MAGRTPDLAVEGAEWPEESLLGRLAPPVRGELLRIGTRVTLAADRPILWQGEPTTHVFLLLTGCVKIMAAGEDGTTESLLGIRIRGDLVGEMAALSDKPRSAFATTAAESAARVISQQDLLTFLKAHPHAGIELARMISERLRWANERRIDFTTLPPRIRVCRVLAELVDTYGQPDSGGLSVGAPLSQAEVSSLAGVKLATGEKVLRTLKSAGLVQLHYRRIVVMDLPALFRMVENN